MSALLESARQSAWWPVLERARGRWGDVDGDQRAAAFAYFLLLSVVPLTIMLVTVGSLFVEREVATLRIVQVVNHYVPLSSAQERAAEATVDGLIAARGKINLAAFALLVWGALKFVRALIRTANRIWRSPLYNVARSVLRPAGDLQVGAQPSDQTLRGVD